MRELMRSIARERMRTIGVEHINKKRRTLENGKIVYGKSPFAVLWRSFLDPQSKNYKTWLHAAAVKNAEYRRKERERKRNAQAVD